ncbi:hypothetical protein M8J77_005483 [Diaphorina citri]|nr:hypothetical protein M8J77_005483 [Diaphorina citri]
MLKDKWQDKTNNVTILSRIGEERPGLLNTIKERKMKFAGHVMRGSNGQLMKSIVDGKIEGTRGRGRPRRVWDNDLVEWLGRTFEEIQELAVDRTSYRSAIFSVLATSNLADATHE